MKGFRTKTHSILDLWVNVSEFGIYGPWTHYYEVRRAATEKKLREALHPQWWDNTLLYFFLFPKCPGVYIHPSHRPQDFSWLVSPQPQLTSMLCRLEQAPGHPRPPASPGQGSRPWTPPEVGMGQHQQLPGLCSEFLQKRDAGGGASWTHPDCIFSSFPSSDWNWAKEASDLPPDPTTELKSEASIRVPLPWKSVKLEAGSFTFLNLRFLTCKWAFSKF